MTEVPTGRRLNSLGLVTAQRKVKFPADVLSPLAARVRVCVCVTA